jgi:hypothetical protein
VLVFARRVRLRAPRHVRRIACLEQFLLSARRFPARRTGGAGKRLGYRALALTDECSLAGVVRAHVAAKEHGIALIVGAELCCTDQLKLVALATSRASYGALSRLISRARRASAKGSYRLAREHLENALDGCVLIWLPGEGRERESCREEQGPLAARALRRALMARRGTADERLRCAPFGAARGAGKRRWTFRASPPATCTCIGAAAAHCKTC